MYIEGRTTRGWRSRFRFLNGDDGKVREFEFRCASAQAMKGRKSARIPTTADILSLGEGGSMGGDLDMLKEIKKEK
jgi:hypothetical protein